MHTETEIRDLINTSYKATARALVSLFEQQTVDEQATASTVEHNGRGYNGADAEFGTSLAKQVMAGRRLSEKQVAAARRMLQKYVGQLTRIANARSQVASADTLMADAARLWCEAYNISVHLQASGEGMEVMQDKYREFGGLLKDLRDALDAEQYAGFCRYLSNLVGVDPTNVNPLHVAAVVVADGSYTPEVSGEEEDPDWAALYVDRPAGDLPPHKSAAEALNEWAAKSRGRKPYRPVMAAH